MNTQEKAQLQQFLDTLVAAKGVDKLPDADQLIRAAVARQPDAAYLLVQRCMLLEQGIAQSKARIAELEEARVPSRSFLGEGYQPSPPPRNAPGAPAPYAPAPAAAYGAPPAAGFASGGGSFLGQAAATAAGVAGGAFLFEGLEHMFGHQQPGFGSGSFIPTTTENVTVNNFYEGQDKNDDSSDDDSVTDDDTVDDDDADFDDDSSSDGGTDWT